MQVKLAESQADALGDRVKLVRAPQLVEVQAQRVTAAARIQASRW